MDGTPTLIRLTSPSEWDAVLAQDWSGPTASAKDADALGATVSWRPDPGRGADRTSGDTTWDDAPVVRLVDEIVRDAIARRASDVHVEPGPDDVVVRFRIDGMLYDVRRLGIDLLRPLVSRLKILASIDITQWRIPQDGRFSMDVAGRSVDIRVATAPTVHGEIAVLRLLDRSEGLLDLGGLGFAEAQRMRYEQAFRSPQGTVLVTGPTGSGKTSTIYATISAINSRERNIMAIEDPIEYRLAGMKQMQVNTRAGMTFPVALRSILRCDPDVILVGEIRDAETAAIAAGAAMTGHLVFSTLHATRAAAAAARLVDMGVEPYLVASSLTCVVAQRLARRLCNECAQEIRVDVGVLMRLGAADDQFEDARLRRPIGCDACHGTGYRGRIALYEVLTMSEAIARLILERASSREIEQRAIEEGMETLRREGITQVLHGVISIDELFRVTT